MSFADTKRGQGTPLISEMNNQALTDSTSASISAIEDQLALVIRAAREVSVVAEELLREFSTLQVTAQSADKSIPQAIVVAPRLLSATQQQLTSLLAMLKTV